MVPCRALIFALASSLALSIGCGDDAASSGDGSATDDSKDDSKGTDDDTGGKRVDASVNKPDGSTRQDAGSASDAGKPGDGARDAGGEKDAKVGSIDAAASGPDSGNTSAPGQCNDATPHGCYVAQAGNHPMCPAQSPEQSSSYPPMNEWKGCNGIKTSAPFTLDQDAKCAYKGPAGELATCLCDTDLHWVCGCGGSAIGPWPVCTP